MVDSINTQSQLQNGQQNVVVEIPLSRSTSDKQNSQPNNNLLNKTTSLNNNNVKLPPLKLISANQTDQLVKEAKQAFQTNKTKDVKFRKKQLKQLSKLVDENTDAICAALREDLNKPEFETKLCEIALLKNELLEFENEIESFAQPNPKTKTLLSFFDDVYVQNEPLGTVLVMGAWNYPFLLSLSPFAGAIAAGNCVVLKNSEHSPATGALLADLIEKYLDTDCYKVINCDLDTSKYLLAEHKFDHIFYTGGENGGRAVYESASKNLTPIVLELGGKSPVYIDDECCDREAVWARLFWGKFINAGQTCIAPDYVLCSEKAQQVGKKHFNAIMKQFYNNDVFNSEHYTRIINHAHFERLKKLLKESSIVLGGKLDKDNLIVEPAIVLDVTMEDKVMQEEIFGPILPFVTCSSVQKAIEIINSRPKPLALYVFSESKKVQQQFLTKTSSGGVCINDTILQINSASLPFGGIGNSGFGKYHGKYSLEAFSHSRSVLARGFSPLLDYIGKKRYPPYNNESNLQILLQLGMNRKFKTPGPLLASFIGFASGAASVFAIQFVQNSGFL